MSERILVLVAHPDDESLGCGATIARHIKSGDAVSIVVMADGIHSRSGMSIASGGIAIAGITAAIKDRHGAFRKAAKILGTENCWIHQFVDNEMDGAPLLQVVQYIERHVERFKPSIVYTHDSQDMNVDHRVVHEAVKVACRPQPGCTVKQLFFFEVPCSSAWGDGFKPDYYVEVAGTMHIKLAACACYEEEMRAPPHPRSLENVANLAKHRGSHAGLEYAEAFRIGRIVA